MGLPTSSVLRSSLSRCTTSLSPRLFPATTLVLTSRTSPSRTSSEDLLPPTPRTSPLQEYLTSPLRFLTATAPCSTVTLPISPASSLRSRRRWTVVPARPLRTTLSSSSLGMPPLSGWCPPSPCVSSPSASSPPSEGSPSGTWGRPWLWGSSRPPLPSLLKGRLPSLLTRPRKRSEYMAVSLLYNSSSLMGIWF